MTQRSYIFIGIPKELVTPNHKLSLLQHLEFYLDERPSAKEVKPGLFQFKFSRNVSQEELELINEVVTIDFPLARMRDRFILYTKRKKKDKSPKTHSVAFQWITDGNRISKLYPGQELLPGWRIGKYRDHSVKSKKIKEYIKQNKTYNNEQT